MMVMRVGHKRRSVTSVLPKRLAVGCRDNPRQNGVAAAQVNLFLRIVRRREDGYHDLASLFHVIDLGDGMEFTVLPDGADRDELRCDMEGVPTDESNLVIKAGSCRRASLSYDRIRSLGIFFHVADHVRAQVKERGKQHV